MILERKILSESFNIDKRDTQMTSSKNLGISLREIQAFEEIFGLLDVLK